MNWTRLSVVATLTATLIASPATAYADCGDPGQEPCTGPVPTADEVVGIMEQLTDSNVPAASKGNIVTPGFSPDEAGTIDDHLNQMNTRYAVLPYTFVVTDIQPAASNLAGATVTTTGSYHQRSLPEAIALADHGGHWLITHDTAMTVLNNYWHNASHWLINRTGSSSEATKDEPDHGGGGRPLTQLNVRLVRPAPFLSPARNCREASAVRPQ